MQGVKNKKFLMLLGAQIRQLRISKGMTQVDLAIAIENHAEQIGRIERGELNVSSCTLLLISQGLEISMKELFDFEIK